MLPAGREPRFSEPQPLLPICEQSAAIGDSIMHTFRKASCVSWIGLLLVASCAAPAPQIVTKEVRIPVAVACVDRTAVPAEPAPVALPLDARLAADIAAAQALSYKAWGRSLYALIQPCTK